MSPDSSSEQGLPQNGERAESKPRIGVVDVPRDRLVTIADPELDEKGEPVDPNQVVLKWKDTPKPQKPRRLDRFLHGRAGQARILREHEGDEMGAVPTSEVHADGRVIRGASEIRPGESEGHRRRPVIGEDAKTEFTRDKNGKIIGVKVTFKEVPEGTYHEWDFDSMNFDQE